MSNVPWHKRPAIIVALLVVFPPAGIVLMWMRLPWAHKTKLAVSGITGAWFVAMLVLGNVRQGSSARSTPPSAAATTDAPPTKQEPTPTARPAPAPPPPPGRTLIEQEPLLLIPAKLDGFVLASGSRLPPKAAVGAAASYYGENKHLVAHVDLNKSDVKPWADDTKPVKVGEHDGLLVDNPGDKTISIEWVTSGWHGLVTVDYERTPDQDAARKAVQAIAPQVGALLDQYLTGTPPSEPDRQAQLAAIGRAAVVELIAKLEREGVTSDVVVGAHQDEHAAHLLVVAVGPSWSRSTKQDRRATAQKLQAAWADLHSPGDPESSSVTLVDHDGRTVGLVVGSNVTVE